MINLPPPPIEPIIIGSGRPKPTGGSEPRPSSPIAPITDVGNVDSRSQVATGGTEGPLYNSPSHGVELAKRAVELEHHYGRYGLYAGLAVIFAGILLCAFGVVGSTSWTAKLFNSEWTFNDAAPGIVLIVVGLFIILVTKPRVKIGDIKG